MIGQVLQSKYYYKPWDLCWEKCSKNKNMETKEIKIKVPEWKAHRQTSY